MKSSLLTGFRAISFAVGAFILLAIGGIRVQSSMDVFMFVIGLVVFWIVIETIFMNMKKKKTAKPPHRPWLAMACAITPAFLSSLQLPANCACAVTPT